MVDIFISNFVTLGMIVGFTLQIITGNLFEKRVERLFLTGIFMIFLLVVVDMVDHFFALQDTLNNLRYVSSAIGYILRPAYVCIIISILLRNSKKNLILWIPIIILFFVVVSSPFNHLMFYFSDDNLFYRGPLGLISHFISAAYLITLLITTLRMYHVIDKKETVTVLFILIFHAASTSLESILGISFLLTGAMIASCAIYYIYLYVQVYKYDVMTGMLNRRSFYTDALSLHNNKMVVISIDLNNLKAINDEGGHAAGDIAICIFSDVIKHKAKNSFHAYRTGGDEFMVLGVNKSISQANEFIEQVKCELKKTEYKASFGCSMYSPGDDFDEVCIQADMAMYKDKETYKVNLKHRTVARRRRR